MLHILFSDFQEGRTIPIASFKILHGHEIFIPSLSTISTMEYAWRNSNGVEDGDTLLPLPPAAFHILGGFLIHSSLGSVFLMYHNHISPMPDKVGWRNVGLLSQARNTERCIIIKPINSSFLSASPLTSQCECSFQLQMAFLKLTEQCNLNVAQLTATH